MKRIANIIGIIISFIYPYAVSKKVGALFRHIYGGYNKRKFKRVGKNVIINYPCLIVGNNICLGDNVEIKGHSVIATHKTNTYPRPYIFIGEGSLIGEYCHLTAAQSLTIGENVLLGRRVTITDNSHGHTNRADMSIPPLKRRLVSKGPVNIGDNVWIGENAVILPGINIGEGAIIGASAIVTGDVPAYSIAVGNPMRIISKVE